MKKVVEAGKCIERLFCMNVEIKHYPAERFSPIFYKVIDFLKMHGAQGYNKNWHWARWEWLMGHLNLERETLGRIGYIDGWRCYRRTRYT